MKRIVFAVCGLGLLALTVPVSAQGDKLTVKEVMRKVNKESGSLFPTIRKGLNADNPDWADLQKQAKELVTLVESLAKKEPPHGEKASWAKFTKDYAADAKALADAGQKKSKDEMISAHTKITKVCKACHDAHRRQ